jgi:HAD superfamily hydrolase (TIGR01662 family)
VRLPTGVETLFLDAGGVLVFPNWDRIVATMARHGVAANARAMADAEPRVRHELDTSGGVAATSDRTRAEAFWGRLLDLAGVPRNAASVAALEELETYHAEHNLWELVPEDVEPSLRHLRRLGLRLAVVSNSNGTVRRKLDRLGLGSHFEVVVDSAEERIEKPDPALFRIALSRMKADCQSTLHVGDLYHVDVVGARRAGLHAALLDPLALYPGADCPRFPTLGALAEALASAHRQAAT